MNELTLAAGFVEPLAPERIEVVGLDDLAQFPRWRIAFADERKDHRYFELVQD
jgi:hypothetical protein